jgi:hypothetical protein
MGLLTLVLLGYLVFGYEEASASNPNIISQGSTGMRQFYLSYLNIYNGANADTACATDYHFASLWEILDPSNLKYNTTLGYTLPDSGSGPPTRAGWVRTGYSSYNSPSIAGQANCSAWTTTSGYGTSAGLVSDWNAGTEDMHVWEVFSPECSGTGRVWCLED